MCKYLGVHRNLIPKKCVILLKEVHEDARLATNLQLRSTLQKNGVRTRSYGKHASKNISYASNPEKRKSLAIMYQRIQK